VFIKGGGAASKI